MVLQVSSMENITSRHGRLSEKRKRKGAGFKEVFEREKERLKHEIVENDTGQLSRNRTF